LSVTGMDEGSGENTLSRALLAILVPSRFNMLLERLQSALTRAEIGPMNLPNLRLTTIGYAQ
jgi:hypothetical protein